MATLKKILNLFMSTPLVFMTIFNDDCTTKQSKSPAMFMFGDSYFDAGNNNYINTSSQFQANFWPYGESYFDIPTGRLSNGRLIPDFIAQHARLGLIPPYLEPRRSYENYTGANFASAGAGVLSETHAGYVINMRTQLKNYKKELDELAKKKGNAEAARISSKAVYFFSFGTNDYGDSQIFQSKYVEMVVGNLSTALEEVYQKGARKFVFLTLGVLGCLPGERIYTQNGVCSDVASDLAALHNKALIRMLSEMEQKLQGFKYFVYDYKHNLAQRTSNPSKYGFKDGTNACCGSGDFNGINNCGGKRELFSKEFNLCENPSEFIYWDAFHLTQMVYKQMADQMWSTPTLKRFFLC